MVVVVAVVAVRTIGLECLASGGGDSRYRKTQQERCSSSCSCCTSSCLHSIVLGATPGQLHNGPIVRAAGPASWVLCNAQLVGQGVPA